MQCTERIEEPALATSTAGRPGSRRRSSSSHPGSLTSGTAVLAIADATQELLLSTALLGAGYSVQRLSRDEGPAPSLTRLLGDNRRASVLVIDPAWAAWHGGLQAIISTSRALRPELAIAVSVADRVQPTRLTRLWLQRLGVATVTGRLAAAHLADDASSLLNLAAFQTGSDWDARRVVDYQRAVHGTISEHESVVAMRKAVADVDLEAITATLRRQLSVQDRRWRLTRYPDCWIGSEAVGLLSDALGVDRARATGIGAAILRRGEGYHVHGEHDLEDGHLYYRWHALSPALTRINPAEVLLRLQHTSERLLADRNWRGRRFPACMVGSELADWLGVAFDLGFAEAVTLGQSLLELHVLRHVSDAHDFCGTGLFYRLSDCGRRDRPLNDAPLGAAG